jgi:hypothetical protein
MSGYVVGYARGEIEPQIAPLVDAVRRAGFVTFSSCEGHVTLDQEYPRFPSVAFYAHEDEAKDVHTIYLIYRDLLKCSWIFLGTFVCRNPDAFVLGWTLENTGIIEQCDGEQFEARTLEASWNYDIPILIKMFDDLAAKKEKGSR